MISFTHSRLNKDIGSKAFFTMATLLMPLLENVLIQGATDKNPAHCAGGWTPLHFAAFEGHIQVIKAIHNHVTGDKNPKNDDGKTPKEFLTQFHPDKLEAMRTIVWE